MMKLLSVALSINILFAGSANAAEIPISGPTDWILFQWIGGDGTVADDSYRVSQGGLLADIQDGFLSGDVFQILQNGSTLGFTSSSTVGTSGGEDPDTASGISGYTRGTFDLGPGLLTIVATSSPWGNGGAWIRFRNSSLFSDFLVSESAPVLDVKNGTASCTPGRYRLASGSSADISSAVYTLVVNGNSASRIAYDPSHSIAAHLLSDINQTLSGAASSKIAMWDVSKLSNFEARCEVTVAKSGFMFNSSSNTIEDAAREAEKNAAALAWEAQRSSATAANFTKEARELRKRLAARQP